MTAMASRLIARWGQAAEIEVPGEMTGPEYAPVQGPPTLHPCTVALTDYETEERDGTLIAADDVRALVSVDGLSIAPTTADKLLIGGDPFTIVRVAPLAPDGVARFYELQVRR